MKLIYIKGQTAFNALGSEHDHRAILLPYPEPEAPPKPKNTRKNTRHAYVEVIHPASGRFDTVLLTKNEPTGDKTYGPEFTTLLDRPLSQSIVISQIARKHPNSSFSSWYDQLSAMEEISDRLFDINLNPAGNEVNAQARRYGQNVQRFDPLLPALIQETSFSYASTVPKKRISGLNSLAIMSYNAIRDALTKEITPDTRIFPLTVLNSSSKPPLSTPDRKLLDSAIQTANKPQSPPTNRIRKKRFQPGLTGQ